MKVVKREFRQTVFGLLALTLSSVLITGCLAIATSKPAVVATNVYLLYEELELVTERLEVLPFSDTERLVVSNSLIGVERIVGEFEDLSKAQALAKVVRVRSIIDQIAGHYSAIEAEYQFYLERTGTDPDQVLYAYGDSAKLVHDNVTEYLDELDTDESIDPKVVGQYLGLVLRILATTL